MDEAVSKQLEDGFSTLLKAESIIINAKSAPVRECILIRWLLPGNIKLAIGTFFKKKISIIYKK